MNARMIFKCVCVSALFVHATSGAYATAVLSTDTVRPAECYTTPKGQKNHQRDIDTAKIRKVDRYYQPPYDPDEWDTGFEFEEVSIKWTQTQATDTSPIKLDASGSTVPSGKIDYTWNANQKGPVIMTDDGNKGSYRTVRLTISDKVCGVSATTAIRVTSK